MAALLVLAAIGMAAAPADAFSENRFIETWNANAGVLERASERRQADPTTRQRVRTRRLTHLRGLVRVEGFQQPLSDLGRYVHDCLSSA